MEYLTGIFAVTASKWTLAVVLPLIFGWLASKINLNVFNRSLLKSEANGFARGKKITTWANNHKYLRHVWEKTIENVFIKLLNLLIQYPARWVHGCVNGLNSDDTNESK